MDLPDLIDSALRHADFSANRLWEPPSRSVPGPVKPVPQGEWLLCALIVFLMYGVTPDALCGVFPPPVTFVALMMLAMALSIGAWKAGDSLYSQIQDRLQSRSKKRQIQQSGIRKNLLIVWTSIPIVVFAGVSLWILTEVVSKLMDPTTCEGVSFQWSSLAQLFVAVSLSGFSILALKRETRLARAMGSYFAKVRHLSQKMRRTSRKQAASRKDKKAPRRPSIPNWVYAISLVVPFFFLSAWSLLAPTWPIEASNQPYVTNLSVLTLPFVFISLCAPAWADLVMRKFPTVRDGAFDVLLNQTEFFEVRGEPDIRWHRICYAMSAPLLRFPVLLLIVPALVAIMAPIGEAFRWACFALIVWFFFLFQGSLTNRWRQMVVVIGRLFLVGLPMVVSVAVITLGIMRIVEFQYVSYILDAAPLGALTISIIAIYVFFWLFEMAINRPLMIQLLAILSGEAHRDSIRRLNRTRFMYQIESGRIGTDVRVLAKPRFLQIHGTGRFLNVGRNERSVNEPVFQSYTRPELFEHLLACGREIDPKRQQAREVAWADLQRRIRLYFAPINFLAILLAAGLAWIVASRPVWMESRPLIEVVENQSNQDLGFSLEAALIKRGRKGEPAILVAGSGGGTRAALYTTSVLRGLAELGLANSVVLMSGVSGGSAAIAHFAANREVLLTPSADGASHGAWAEFVDAVSYPFVTDVIEGAAEARANVRDSYSHLLKESMARNLGIPGSLEIGQIRDVGVIISSTVAGHPADDSALLRRFLGEGTSHESYVTSRGGRLVFSNVAELVNWSNGGVYRERSLADAVRLHINIVRSMGVNLSDTVAASANFPAVFPNTALLIYGSERRDGIRKYYVTDGGVMDNRGLLIMLYALRMTMRSVLHRIDSKDVPEIHVLVAEASSFGLDYSRDRGLGAAFSAGAKTQLADGLIRELLSDICHLASEGQDEVVWEGSQAKCSEKIRVHFLNMPTVFRARKGFGTHWMMPARVRLDNPRATSPRTADDLRMSCPEMIASILQLHSVETDYCVTRDDNSRSLEKLRLWVCGRDSDEQDPHRDSWQGIVEHLGLHELRQDFGHWQRRTEWRHCQLH